MKRLLIYIFFIFLFFQAQAQTKQVDSLKQLLLFAKDDTTIYNLCRLISWQSMWSYSDTALSYAQKALLLTGKMKDPQKESEALLLCGTAWWVIGNYPLAVDFNLKGIHSEEQFKRPRINEFYGIPILQLLYYNLSESYKDLGDYQHAYYYYSKAKTVPYDNVDDNLKELYLHLGIIYEKFDKLDSALFYEKKAYDLDVKMNGRSDRMQIPIILGHIYRKKANPTLAAYYYHIAQGNPEFNSTHKDAIEVYNGLAKNFAEAGRPDSSIFYAEKALNLGNLTSYPVGILNTCSILSEIYKKNGRLDSAVKYLEQTNSLRATLFSQQKEREVQNLSFNEKLRMQEMLAEQEQYRNKIRIYAALAIAAILFLTAIILWRNIQHRKKSYRLLQEQKEETDKQKQKVEITLAELKSTQAQLIQQEKMASLGELTAGIAHEIQNPLNFVNNFSEVNSELIAEMKQEIDKGDFDEVKTIANDIDDNEQKIIFHGKRADAIVKGMLQHSRSSSGVKEPTDINALADEYLRLAYHGLRAKDKSFNATMKTDYDESIGSINIIPQDIGRVILNLITNAFYAVDEKKKLNPKGYEPTVSVSTKKINGKVEIYVKDNGNGIPQKVLDKIFQPFFTTKPTGQGTGLGLSLSYDIIKAHGGEIRVETKENEGTEFIIQLPVV